MTSSISGRVTQNDNLDNREVRVLTYGALILPYDIELAEKENKPETDPKETTKQEGKIKSAFKKVSNSRFGRAVKSSQNVRIITEYMKDKRNMTKLGAVFGIIGDKFSGIAITQAIMNGKISSREALDYFFMGFAPALGVTGSLFGYSGLMQMKDALFNGKVDVGAFINGFKTALKGGIDLKDMITMQNVQKSANVLEFDLTISHSETYQSETPDRRVQSGQSLNEYVHNMPVTFDVQCALQEGKRYSKAEFRAILDNLRKSKMVVSLVLGDEIFENLILTNFNPTHDCSKSGMDYALSFKEIVWGTIETDREVQIQTKPKTLDVNSSSTTTYGGLGGANSKINVGQVNSEIKSAIGGVTLGVVDTMSAAQNKDKSWAASLYDTYIKPNVKK